MGTQKEYSNSGFASILKGEFIADENNQRYTPFILMMVTLILINISISFRAERLLKQSISLEVEVADLRLRYITTKSQLMSIYKRSTIEEMVSNQGLETSLTPVYIIDINEE